MFAWDRRSRLIGFPDFPECRFVAIVFSLVSLSAFVILNRKNNKE